MTVSPEWERLERVLALLEECEPVLMRAQEEHGGIGDLLRRVQNELG